MADKNYVAVIDFVLIVGTLLALVGTFGYVQPLVIGPIDGLETTNSSVLFSFEKAEAVLIDDNLDFTSPTEIFVEDNLVINLKPGKYYWKVLGVSESEVRELTIVSEIELKVRSVKDRYELVNSGNTLLDVEIYENGAFAGKISLDVDESEEVSGTKFIGSESRGKDE